MKRRLRYTQVEKNEQKQEAKKADKDLQQEICMVMGARRELQASR